MIEWNPELDGFICDRCDEWVDTTDVRMIPFKHELDYVGRRVQWSSALVQCPNCLRVWKFTAQATHIGHMQ